LATCADPHFLQKRQRKDRHANQPITSRLELEAAIQEKAGTDAAFRAALLANPAAALEQAFGLPWSPA
jgi:hypothetical protein